MSIDEFTRKQRDELRRAIIAIKMAKPVIAQLSDFKAVTGNSLSQAIDALRQQRQQLAVLHSETMRQVRQSLSPLVEVNQLLRQTTRAAFAPYMEAFQIASQVRIGFADHLKQIRQALGPYEHLQQAFASIPKGQLEQIRQALSGFTDSFQKYLAEEEKRIFAVLAKRGWLGLEEYLTSTEMRRILVLNKSGGKKAVDAFVCRKFRRHRHKLLNKVVRSWWRAPYMKRRRRAVRAALKAHKEQRYVLSMPTLLPLVDGLAVRFVGRLSGSRKAIQQKEAAKRYHSVEKEVWSECVETVITSLMYKDYDFTKKPPSTLNRHAIMHGEVIGYASEANSLKVMLLVDTYVRILFREGSSS